MLPFKTMLNLDRHAPSPLYLQLSNQIIQQINFGHIPPGYKMPGTRKLGDLLHLNRRTVALAYEELDAQGWLDIIPSSGAYVSSSLTHLAT